MNALLRAGPDSLAFDSLSGHAPEHMKVRLRDGAVSLLSKELPEGQTAGENVGVLYLSGSSVRRVFAHGGRLLEAGREDAFLAEAVNAVAAEQPIRAVDIAGVPWTEIDSPFDLDRARRERWPEIQARTGERLLKRRRKRRLAASVAAAALAAPAVFLAAACAKPPKADWQDIPPSAPKTSVVSKGVRTGYTSLSPGERLSATVEGPCDVRVYFRLALETGQTRKVPFTVEVAVDGAAPKVKKFKAEADPDARTESGGAVGDRDSADLKIKAGAHRVTVAYVSGPPGPLLVMMRQAPPSRP